MLDSTAHARAGKEFDAQTQLSPTHVDAFWAKVALAKQDECWLWQAARAVNGYGVYGVARKTPTGWKNSQQKAHRIAWSLVNGPIAPGLVVRHMCDNPPCCNPAHLLIGTADDNVADKVERQRQSRGEAHSCIMQTVVARGEANGNAKLTVDLVRSIRAERESGAALPDLVAKYNLSQPTIYRVCARRSWRHVA